MERKYIQRVYGKRKAESEVAKKYTKVPRMMPYKRYSRPELKNHSGTFAAANFDTTATFNTFMSNLTEGSADGKRTGGQVTVKSFRLRVFVYPKTPLTDIAPTTQRIMLYIDKEPNGVAQNITGLLSTNNWYANTNASGFGRFKVLRDVYYHTTGTINTATQAINHPVSRHIYDWYFKFPKGLKVKYNSNNAGLETDVQKNNICLMTLGDTASAVNTSAFIQIYRVRYFDY